MAYINDVKLPNGNIFDLHDKYAAYITPQMFGAKGDGVTDDTNAFKSAIGQNILLVIPKGTYKVSQNLTFNVPVVFTGDGSILKISGAITVTFNGGIEAPVAQIFDLSANSAVKFNPNKQSVGYPEWWGAKINTYPHDCSPYINACIRACKITELQEGTYYTDHAVVMDTEHRTLRGKGWDYTGTSENGNNSATRICLMTSPNEAVIFMGYAVKPAGGINAFCKELVLENIDVVRLDHQNISTSGVQIQYTLYAEINKVKSEQSVYGFRLVGAVTTRVTKCTAFMSNQSTIFFAGFYVDGITDVIAAGGNASTYIDRCTASTGAILLRNSIGLLANGAISDLYVNQLECAEIGTGIQIDGAASSTGYTKANFADVMIINPVIDMYLFAGVNIQNIPLGGSVVVQGGYSAPISKALYAASEPTGAFYIRNTKAMTRLRDFQAVLWCRDGVRGLVLDGCENVESSIMMFGARGNAIDLFNTKHCKFTDIITSEEYTTPHIVYFWGYNNYSYFNINFSGNATFGYRVRTEECQYNEFNCTGLPPIGTGKVSYLDVAITNKNDFGTGNVITGVY